jgi:hypothetical protein
MRIWQTDPFEYKGLSGFFMELRRRFCRFLMLHSAAYSRWERDKVARMLLRAKNIS